MKEIKRFFQSRDNKILALTLVSTIAVMAFAAAVNQSLV